MIEEGKLLSGYSHFPRFSERSCIYVDKTDLIATLAAQSEPIFLSRPRNFGKSTLVSTFEELFSHGLEKFKALKIDTQNLWHDKTYKVLHLDFLVITEEFETGHFEQTLFDFVQAEFKWRGIDIEDNPSNLTEAFKHAFDNVENGSMVLLIDEYDAPLFSMINNRTEFEQRSALLSEFFSIIKTYSEKFRFIFITGVTRYSSNLIFSAFNNLNDISFDPKYGALLGFTHEELEFYFKDYLEDAAEVLNLEENTDTYTYKDILKLIKNNYYGYSFDKECTTYVYNPWSIIMFLKYPSRTFISYWLENMNLEQSIIADFLNTIVDHERNLTRLIEYQDLDFTQSVNIFDLSPNLSNLTEDNFPSLAFLYQTGYFTIKHSDGETFKVGIPNLEIKNAFADVIAKNLTSCESRRDFTDHYANFLVKALETQNIEAIKKAFNIILSKYTIGSRLGFSDDILKLNFKFACDTINLGIEVREPLIKVKMPTIKSPSDKTQEENALILEVKNYIYIIVFKVSPTLEQIKNKLKQAKELLLNKLANLDAEKTVVGLAYVIVNQSKSPRYPKPVRRVEKLEEVRLLEIKQ